MIYLEGEYIMFDLDNDYINSNGKIIRKEELSYISRGSNASVWKFKSKTDNSLENMAFKVFFDHAYKNCLNFQTYEKLKKLPLKNIIKPNDIYYKLDNTFKSEKDFDAYTMLYLEEKKDILLSEISLDYLLENINSLENDIKILTEYNILMHDIKAKNSIICSKDCKLYIIDVDMFLCTDGIDLSDINIYFSNYKVRKFNNLKENMYMLLSLIKAHFLYDIDKLPLNDNEKCRLRNFLYCYFVPDNIGNESISNMVEKLFEGYDSPKEYFLKR